MSDVTQILQRIEGGDPNAAEKLLPLVYDELRKLAAARMSAESPDHTLQATALVHEAYIRLVDTDRARHWNSHGHFFTAAAEAMRRILVDHARRRRSLKRGGGTKRINLDERLLITTEEEVDLLALNEALDRFQAEEPRMAELVKLRFFAGLENAEAASALGVSEATAKRDWTYARAWLYGALHGE